jgi:uncharacterized protein
MQTSENKRLVGAIFEGLSRGDARLFIETMHDDFRWTITGSTAWSKTYDGKAAVLRDLFGPLRMRLPGTIRTKAQRLIADGDIVVVEARGDNITSDGKRYDNEYCYIIRLDAGRLVELTEYLDTELVTTSLRRESPTDHRESPAPSR